MKNKIHQLKIRAVNRGIFEAIRTGEKKVETRAATAKYRKIEKGNIVQFVCGREKFVRRVVAARVFPNVAALLKKYQPSQINPSIGTVTELRKIYYSFPGYREKIKKYGLIAWELE